MHSCRHPRCPVTLERGWYCDKHKPPTKTQDERKQPPRRGIDKRTMHGRGYNNEYKRVRIQVLRRDEWCVVCQVKESVVAHHDPPYVGGDEHDAATMFGMCRECHERTHGRLK
jgi:hypothetical protein